VVEPSGPLDVIDDVRLDGRHTAWQAHSSADVTSQYADFVVDYQPVTRKYREERVISENDFDLRRLPSNDLRSGQALGLYRYI